MSKGFKILICSDCSKQEVKVDISTNEVTCSKCVTKRVELLKETGEELFVHIFYETLEKERDDLLNKILNQLRENNTDGSELIQARNRKGWSQLSLSAYLGISKTLIVNMEKNRIPLNLKAIEFIHRASQ